MQIPNRPMFAVTFAFTITVTIGSRAAATTNANGTQLQAIAIAQSGGPAAASPNGTTVHTSLSVPLGGTECFNGNGDAVTIGFFIHNELPPSAVHDWMILE